MMTSHFVCVYTFYIFCVWLVLLPHTERVVRSALCVVSLVPNWFNVQCNHTNEIWGTRERGVSLLLFFSTNTHIEATSLALSLSGERFSVLFFSLFIFFPFYQEKKFFDNLDHVVGHQIGAFCASARSKELERTSDGGGGGGLM